MSAPAKELHRQAKPDKRWVGRSFSRAAPGYDQVSALQRRVGDQLLKGVSGLAITGPIVELGCGTGYCTDRLGEAFPGRPIVALDLAEGMLQVLRTRSLSDAHTQLICGDLEHLPLANTCTDLLFSNLAVQWCENLGHACPEAYRILSPGGHFAFTTFTRGTLEELRRAWAQVDAHTHVNTFLPLEMLEAELARAGFTDIAIAEETILASYPEVKDLMLNLKELGARNLTDGRPRQLTGKGRLRAMIEAYPGRAAEDPIQASFHVAYCHARRP